MSLKLPIATIAAASMFILCANDVSAHASLPHRHFHGRVYYWTESQHHPVIWSDDCGRLWSYGDVMVDRAYRVQRVNPLPEEVPGTKTETTTRVTRTTTREQTEK